ncbi:MAG: DUF2189 domain-containing protein [Thiotrichales bacterium]|nr:DUF2189 domain-containing protein [Thiotrichales bacterium]
MSDTEIQQDNIKPDTDDKVMVIPEVRALTFADLRECLGKGIADFRRAPMYGLFFGGIFTFIGMFIAMALFVWGKSWMMYPVMIGFPLIGPFAAVGLYEVSRRLDAGLPLTWNGILSVILLQTQREIHWMAFVMLFIFWVWMYQIRMLIAIILGRMSFATLESFLEIITTTTEGLIFIAIGHVVGACFSLVLFSVTFVSMPLLLERDLDFISAMITSMKAVAASPIVMLTCGVCVTVAVLTSFIPAFLGLLVVLPVLGHASWHIYKRAVV